jgi:hypothetical protein
MAPASAPEADAALTAAIGMGRVARWAMSPAAYTRGTLVLANSSTSTHPSGSSAQPSRPARSERWWSTVGMNTASRSSGAPRSRTTRSSRPPSPSNRVTGSPRTGTPLPASSSARSPSNGSPLLQSTRSSVNLVRCSASRTRSGAAPSTARRRPVTSKPWQ